MRLLRRSFALAAAALVALSALPAAAAAQATLKFPSSLSNPTAGGYYVGPFQNASFVSAVGQASTLSIVCVDFLNAVQPGQQFAVSVNNLGYADPLTETRHPGQMLTYRKAAWLGSLFATRPTSQWGAIQYAIWNLFTPAQAPDNAQSPGYLALANVAATNGFGAFTHDATSYSAVDMSDYWVLTDVAAAGRATGGRQEFIATSTAPLGTVPEPGTLVLAATGLAALGAVAARRRSKRVAGNG